MAQVEIGMSRNEFIEVFESVKHRLKYTPRERFTALQLRGYQRFMRMNAEQYLKLKYKGRKRDLAEVRSSQDYNFKQVIK